MFYSERKTEALLDKNNFDVAKREYVSRKKDLLKALKRFNYPVVMKVSGKKIVHKNKIGGVKMNLGCFSSCVEVFNKFEKIKGVEEVVIQEQNPGKEILIGIKKTKEFGHAVCFGAGGVNTEKLNDVSFRIFPFDRKEAKIMISETKICKTLSVKEKKFIEDNILRVCSLIKKFPKISELDINPLIVNQKRAIVVDARMVVE